MLVTKERKTIQKLKRKVGFLIIIIFSLLYWIRMKYLDNEFLYMQSEADQYEIMELESENRMLQFKFDSIQKKFENPNLEKKESKIIINKKQEESKKDSTLPKIIEFTPDHESEEPLDTLNR